MTIRPGVPSLALASVLVLAAGCGPGEPPQVRSDKPRNELQIEDVELGALVEGNTAFAVDLYRRAAAADAGNLFMSPHSVSLTLAMVYAGAAGTTASQLAGALDFTLPPLELHAAMNVLDRELASREDDVSSLTLRSASSLWGQVDFPFQAPFLDLLAENYGAGIYITDFMADPEDSRGAINDWVSHRTNGNIDELLPPGSVSGMTRLVLTNAIYFKSTWAVEFDPDDTEDGSFATPAGAKTVPMMNLTGEDLGYGSGPRFRAAQLDYSGDHLAMIVVLPELLDGESGDPLELLEAELTPDKLQEIAGSITDTYLHVRMPKFEMKATIPLASMLRDMGMTDGFEKSLADFSPIDGTRDLYIHGAYHQGWVKVDESGTEAAAATAVTIGDDSAGPEPEELVFDRPFLFVIRDIPTGAILFVGRVIDPS